MDLTAEQRRRLQQYLREVGQRLGHMPAAGRRAAINRLRDSLYQALAARGSSPPSDASVDEVLRQAGDPESQAQRIAATLPTTGQVASAADAAPAAPPDPPATAAPAARRDGRVWLGVCSGFAEQFEIDVRVLRLVLVVLALVVPLLPFLLLLYIGAWFAFFYPAERPELDIWGITRAVLTVFAIALVLHLIGAYSIEFARRLVYRFLETGVSLGSDWGWLPIRGGAFFFYAFMSLAPLAALSRLPVPKPWSGTLQKIVYAGLSVYALVICFGIASYLAGMALSLAGELQNSPLLDTLK